MTIPEFIRQGEQLMDDTAIQAFCDQEREWLYTTYAATTVHKMMSQYRNAIRDHGLPASFLVYMRERREASNTLRAHYAETIGMRQRQQYPIVEVDALVHVATQCLYSESYTRVIVGLELLTGRRPYEVGVTARMTVADTHHVLFQGQAKTRGTVPDDHTYLVPVLIAPAGVCTALDRLRSLRNFAGYTSQRFDDTAGKTLRDARHVVFGALLPDGALQVKEALRKIYGCIAYDWFARPDISYNAYLADILGHGHTDVNTANSYQDFYLATVK